MGMLAMAAAIAPRPAAAQAPAGETRYAPVVLTLPASTRAMAMGDAGAAVSDETALFYNPAQLVNARGINLAGQRYAPGSTLGTLAVAIPAGGGTLAIGAQQLGAAAPCSSCLAAVPESESSLLQGGDWNTTSAVASVGYARVIKGFRVGAAAKYVQQRLPETHDATAAVDLGVARAIGSVMIGAAAQNLGPSLEQAGGTWLLPQRYTLGAAFQGLQRGPVDLAGSADVSVLANGDVTPAAGAEVGWMPLEGFTFLGRAGVRATHDPAERPWSLGAAFTVDKLMVEYAWRTFEGTGPVHRVGVRWRG
jgi:hypothetical protein